MLPRSHLCLLLACLALACDDADGDKLPGDSGAPSSVQDEDGDGYEVGEDCEDQDAAVHPGATEVCDGIDNDCDGDVDEGVTDSWYQDADGDSYGDPDSALDACEQPSGYVGNGTDCDDTLASAHPSANEICDGTDNDCDGEIDEDVMLSFWADADHDDYGDPELVQEACEQPHGYADNDQDCDDADAEVNPAAEERCNGIDDDCDGDVDEGVTSTWYADADADGYGDPGATTEDCEAPTGYADNAQDCDDADAGANPAASEICDGTDNDCDGSVDEDDADDASTWYADLDGDGFGNQADSAAACTQPKGYVADDSDCDDGDGAVNPGAGELCNGYDDDCDGVVDEDEASDAATWYHDGDGDSYGDAGDSQVSCAQPSGYVADATDCDDGVAEVNPGASELCNGYDDDCDGATDEDAATDAATWYADADADGYGDATSTATACAQPSGYVDDDTDCDDGDYDINPAASERCNGLDDDCDGDVDEDADDWSTWYADADADGYGDGAGATAEACAQPSGYVADDSDCDDGDYAVNPGASELCNGYDDDCDGSVDEGHDADADGIADCDEIEYAVDWISSVDDAWYGYVDEVYYGSYSGWNTSDTISVTMDSGQHVLAVYGWDTGAAIAGFISAVQVDGVTESLTGDGSWVMVDSTSDSNWYTIGYDDSAWGAAQLCNSSSVSQYWGSSPSDLTSLGAQWIWHTSCTSLGDSYYRLVLELP